MTTTSPVTADVLAVDLAQLAREIAMDILPLTDVLKLHQLDDEEWVAISENPRFKAMLEQMMREWNSAGSTRERAKIKAQTGVEAHIETLVRDIGDSSIPLTQRVEALKFMARIGEMDGAGGHGHLVGGQTPFSINISIGNNAPPVQVEVKPRTTLDLSPVLPEDA